VILYRKAAPLRLRRFVAPATPFWCATTVAPYGAKRAVPLSIDYLALRASGAEKLEVTVSENVRAELERAKSIDGPVLIDAVEAAELVFRRGEEVLAFCESQELPALYLASTEGVLPEARRDLVVAIAAWPLDLPRLTSLFARAQARDLQWGVTLPLLHPVTTDLAALTALADLSQKYGAKFLAPLVLDIDATAKQALAANADEEMFSTLFHEDLEPLLVATERHLCALAAERGMDDFILPPRWSERSNWNAAVLLTRTAARMMAMELDHDLASTLSRSAGAIATLGKPLTRIAEAASLSIIGTIDETSVAVLTQWLQSGRAEFVDAVDAKWRVRRDYGAGGGTMNEEG
jgi:hypothetical protein